VVGCVHAAERVEVGVVRGRVLRDQRRVAVTRRGHRLGGRPAGERDPGRSRDRDRERCE
jgi:hypothetical protein